MRYGVQSSVELLLADGVAPRELGTPAGPSLDDPAAATAAVLGAPLEYPSLARSTTPVDRVVLALDQDVPQLAEVTAAVIAALVEAGIAPDGISVLQNRAEGAAEPGDACREVPAALRSRIARLSHDPSDRRQLAYLAASESGEAILVNRALHEADVVLPIGCLRGDESAGYFGIHGGIFPTFSDAKTARRFRAIGALNGRGGQRRELTAEADHVAWLLGVNFTIQVVPAAGGHVLHVLAGESGAVRRRGKELYHAAWNCPVSARVGLVVAAIEGDAGQQTWENVGRALQAAGSFVEEGGSIALCTDLAASPGPALQQLAGTSSLEAALRQLGKERPVDALPAALLAHALQRGKVYLLSRLDSSLVEDLDVVPLAGPQELARLARQHRSGVVLANAPYVTAVAGNDESRMTHDE
jgi:lactate racemase